jgi:putative DNA primase/helicase
MNLLTIIENVPTELANYPQWVSWSGTLGETGKIKKIPISPRTGRFAHTNASGTWGTFEEAVDFSREHNLPGVGFVFTENDDFVGIDFDDCFDPATGEIDGEALDVIERLDTYTEISPSGRGIHVIAKGKLPTGSRKSGKVEMYDDRRFFTITGKPFNGSPAEVRERRNEIREVYRKLFGRSESKKSTAPSKEAQIADAELLELAKNAENALKFNRLWGGDFSGYPSQSEADLALCRMLAFWTARNAEQMDRLFRRSGLFRSKWDVPHYGGRKTYGQATIDKALSFDGEVYGKGKRKTHPDLPKREFKLTDLGNAERLVYHFGEKIRYCHAWRKWLIWDRDRWAIDQSGQIHQLAKKVVRRIYREVQDFALDAGKRQDIAKHAAASEHENRLAAMIALARSEVPITPDMLNGYPWLLNCQNGTIDLRTGEHLPHRMEDFITRLAPVDFEPDARCPRWLEFLDRIMDGNQSLIDFLQRAVGYALTGETSEQVLFIFWGGGANGKSTFLQAMSHVLGDYAMSTPTETLLVKRRGSIPNDVARLKGARFVVACEADAENRLAESLIKQMTGGDTISARFLHQEWFEFEPTHKVFFGTNHKPVIKGNDYAIWRRIRLIPFTITIPEEQRDKSLPEKLKEEASGILAWAVQGCLEWQRRGLGAPEEVKAATDTYREEMDILGEFLKDRCRLNPDAKVSSKELSEAYTDWCEVNGQEPVPQRLFIAAMREKGFLRCRVGHAGIRGWLGLELMKTLPDDIH